MAKETIQCILKEAPTSAKIPCNAYPTLLAATANWWERDGEFCGPRDGATETEAIKLLIEADKGAIRRCYGGGRYPLHSVAAHGTLELW
jgi:hypothetical protein